MMRFTEENSPLPWRTVMQMQTVALVLNLISAASALTAAAFWYLSAQNTLPSMTSYWDGVPDTDPFFIAMQAGIKLNRRAAECAALSALSAGLATFASLR
jgi:hypothetical protein